MASCKTLGYVHSLESFGSVDGPGVRFVVFLQGCALRCKYCHNPETWAEGGEPWTAEALFQRVYRYRNYWGKKGGITVSGGEPLRQMDFLTEFFTLARAKGVHTALDTAGQPFDTAARVAIDAHRAAHPRGRHGRLAYRLHDLGLERAELRERFRYYQEAFDVPDEAP